MSIGPFLGYIFLASIPISYMRFGGNFFIPFEIMIHEMILILLAIHYLIGITFKTKRIYIDLFDAAIITFVFFALIPVIISSDALYIAARDYRHLFFTPVIAYFLFKNCFENVKQLQISFLYLFITIVIVSIFSISEEIMSGTRLSSTYFDNVTLGVLASWGFAILIINRNSSGKIVYKLLTYSGLMYFFSLALFTGSRSVIIGIVISFLLTFVIFRRKIYQKIFLALIIFINISFLMFMFFIDESSLKQNRVKSEEYREVDRTISRIISITHYNRDIKERLHLWKKAFDIGLENPILGSGASLRRAMGLSTPHNIFISTFLTSGFFGTFLFVFLICLFYTTLFSLHSKGEYNKFLRFYFVSFTILLFAGITNDLSGGRYILFFILLSGLSSTNKLIIGNR